MPQAGDMAGGGAGVAKRLGTLLSGLLECGAFCGIIFGWASLVFVLKDLGYFGDLCQPSATPSPNMTVLPGRSPATSHCWPPAPSLWWPRPCLVSPRAPVLGCWWPEVPRVPIAWCPVLPQVPAVLVPRSPLSPCPVVSHVPPVLLPQVAIFPVPSGTHVPIA